MGEVINMEVEEFKNKFETAQWYSEATSMERYVGKVDIIYRTGNKTEVFHACNSIRIDSDWAICCSHYYRICKKIYIPDIIDVKPVVYHLVRAFAIGFAFLFAFVIVSAYYLFYPLPMYWVQTFAVLIALYCALFLFWWLYPKHEFKKEIVKS